MNKLNVALVSTLFAATTFAASHSAAPVAAPATPAVVKA